jgi:hypothetical protein
MAYPQTSISFSLVRSDLMLPFQRMIVHDKYPDHTYAIKAIFMKPLPGWAPDQFCPSGNSPGYKYSSTRRLVMFQATMSNLLPLSSTVMLNRFSRRIARRALPLQIRASALFSNSWMTR